MHVVDRKIIAACSLACAEGGVDADAVVVAAGKAQMSVVSWNTGTRFVGGGVQSAIAVCNIDQYQGNSVILWRSST